MTSVIFSINFDESAKSPKTLSFRAQREISLNYFTNITKISFFFEAIDFLLVCFLHCLREKKFELVESIKLHRTWSESKS